MKRINILIVDDHQLMIDGLKLMLQNVAHFHVVGQAINGKIGLEKLTEEPVDVVLLDINMPVMNGIECCEQIVKHYPHIKVIGLSMLEELTIMQKLLTIGAKGFLVKNAGKEKVIKAIETVMNDEVYMDQHQLSQIMSSISTKKSGIIPKLSRREKEILGLIVKEHTTQEIANQLHIAFGTVETHRRNLINKLKVRNTAGLVRVAMEWGLVD